ncbi:MAG: SLATT domain-containing protein [Magnetococcales bacterium]|nr:SLATT domain-containing protein [Magnetococcales bacterium]MBF0116388.1 SLATT domain-containing protein [Magnetococcales bacterium]
MNKDHVIESLKSESYRIEEDSIYSSKGHYNAAARWKALHSALSVISIVCSTVVASSVSEDVRSFGLLTISKLGINSIDHFFAFLTFAFSATAAISTSLISFLKPERKEESHRISAGNYNSLKNRARIYRTIDLMSDDSIDSLRAKLDSISETRNSLNMESIPIPKWAYALAKKGIEELGEATYKVDTKGV